MTGITALIISKHRVKYPINLFPVRRTLVAPMFPDPIFLISLPKNNFDSKYPKGIDPNI